MRPRPRLAVSVAVLLLAGPLAFACAWALVKAWRSKATRTPAWLWGLCVASAFAFVALYPRFFAYAKGVVELFGPADRQGLVSVWQWWLLALLIVPGLCLLLVLSVPQTLADTPENDSGTSSESGFLLGSSLGGDPLLPLASGQVFFPLKRLQKHALVLGASGSGKTETLLRIAYCVARSSDWRIVYVDAKGDYPTMERFYALMALCGHDARCFPNENYDGWRGSAAEIANRLIELIDFASEGPATYYRDIATSVIRLACEAPGGPPRSAGELLDRLDANTLFELYAGTPSAKVVGVYSQRQIDEVRARYQAFFGSLHSRLDSGFAFEDAHASYILLDGLRLKHDTGKLARFFIEDFSQFASARKPADQRVLFIVDELSAIAASANLADIVERTRTFGVSAVLAPQVLEGMRDSTHTERVVGSTHTTFLHSVPNPENSVRAAGMREHYEPSIEHRDGLPRLGTASPKRRPRVDPDEVRRLGVGCCFVIGSGYAAKVAINKAPHTEPLKLPDGAHTKTEAPVRTHTEPIRP